MWEEWVSVLFEIEVLGLDCESDWGLGSDSS